MKKIKLLLSCVFTIAMLFAFDAPTFAQTTVSGLVTDAETGEPITGATVVLQSNNAKGSASDIDGRYSFSSVSYTHLLRAFQRVFILIS